MRRTFHPGRHDLHGITVVVETTGGDLLVGRCDDIVEGEVILVDADVHREGESELSREDYLRRAARFGVWKRHDRVVVPAADVAGLRRLGEITEE